MFKRLIRYVMNCHIRCKRLIRYVMNCHIRCKRFIRYVMNCHIRTYQYNIDKPIKTTHDLWTSYNVQFTYNNNILQLSNHWAIVNNNELNSIHNYMNCYLNWNYLAVALCLSYKVTYMRCIGNCLPVLYPTGRIQLSTSKLFNTLG